MTLKVGVVMDPIENINVAKDSSLAMMLEAQSRGHELYYMQMDDLYLLDGQARASASRVSVFDDASHWYDIEKTSDIALADLDVILMRKDPPFDTEYIYATYMYCDTTRQAEADKIFEEVHKPILEAAQKSIEMKGQEVVL